MFNAFFQILRKEFFSFFQTGLAYFIIGAYLVLSMLTTFYMGSFFNLDNSRLFSFFYFQTDIFAILLPALTMRLWAEENKLGTVELLLTQPLGYKSIILGKFFAAWLFCLLMLVLTVPFWVYINTFYHLDNLNIFSAYGGCLMVAGSFCALGGCISSLTRSPIIAYILSVLLSWIIIVSRPDYLIYLFAAPENSAADILLALNFGKHYSDFVSGQPGLDNLFYFLLLMLLPLWLNLEVIRFKNRKTAALEAIFMLAAFVFFNLGTGLLFSGQKADMTADRRFTLSPAAAKIAASLETPVYVRLYLSSALGAENTGPAQYSQYVLRMLRKFQAASNKIKLQIISPEPYSETARAAEAAGIRAFGGGQGSTKLYFGIEAVDKFGRRAVIPYLDSRRSNFLEQDLSRIFYKLNQLAETTVDIVAPGLPQIYDGNFVKQLQTVYKIRELSPFIAEIPQDTDLLMVVAASPLPESFAYALEQYLLRGGRILLLLDNYAEIQADADGYAEMDTPRPNDFLQQGGMFLIPDLIVGSTDTAASAVVNGTRRHYPLRTEASAEEINPGHLLTADLRKIRLSSPGGLVIAGNEDYKVTPLITLNQNTVSLPAYLAKLSETDETADLTHYPDQKFILAALSEGRYTSSFSENYYEGLDISRKLTPFLAASINPGKFAVVADADVLDDKLWSSSAASAYDIIPSADNGLFLLRLVDYLAGNESLVALPRREFYLGDTTPGSLLYAEISRSFRTHYNKLDTEIAALREQLETINQNRRETNQPPAVKSLQELDQLKTRLFELEEQRKHLDYRLKSAYERQLDKIVIINGFVIPAVILLLLFGLTFLINRRNRRLARSLCHE